MNPVISSIGTAVPPFKISQSEHRDILEAANGMNRLERLKLHSIYSRSGIESRHSVLEEFSKSDEKKNILFHPANHHPSAPISERMDLFESFASELCVEASNNCFANVHYKPSEVTHLITFSCTGMSAPGLDIQIVEKLKLNRSVERTCINFMGCYAGINALKMAYHVVRSCNDAVVLLCGVELCTLHYRKSESQDQLLANALFADGAAACIVSSSKGNNASYSLEQFYSEFELAGRNEMVWRIANDGFDLKLSAYVPDLIKGSIASLTAKLFSKAHLKKEDIHYYAIHPGGIKILEACEAALDIDKKKNEISYDVLRNFGNMSSVTIFFVLKQYLHMMTKEDNEKNMFVCAFGPGLTMESMLLKIIC